MEFSRLEATLIDAEVPKKAASFKAKGPGLDSGISCRTSTWRSRGSSVARSAVGLSGDSFGAIESYKKMEVLGEGSYATVYRGFSQYVGLKFDSISTECYSVCKQMTLVYLFFLVFLNMLLSGIVLTSHF